MKNTESKQRSQALKQLTYCLKVVLKEKFHTERDIQNNLSRSMRQLFKKLFAKKSRNPESFNAIMVEFHNLRKQYYLDLESAGIHDPRKYTEFETSFNKTKSNMVKVWMNNNLISKSNLENSGNILQRLNICGDFINWLKRIYQARLDSDQYSPE